MDSFSEYLLDVLTKQHIENKNINTLQQIMTNLQKQLMEKDEIKRFLIETQHDLMKMLKSQKLNQKVQNEIQKVPNVITNSLVIFCRTTSSTSLSFDNSARLS